VFLVATVRWRLATGFGGYDITAKSRLRAGWQGENVTSRRAIWCDTPVVRDSCLSRKITEPTEYAEKYSSVISVVDAPVR